LSTWQLFSPIVRVYHEKSYAFDVTLKPVRSANAEPVRS